MRTAPLTSAFTEPERPKGLQIRFITVGGSYVDVIPSGRGSDKHRWDCLGCKDTSRFPLMPQARSTISRPRATSPS
ncbi:hypothetical protein ABZ723_34535, partial [Streptomyces sp. NPDC006700]|uniref:hypothetical protein n=1 Tax=Streptomyces sp. NPDC006700 TaxID=3154479 RepID=UPI003404767A